MLRISSNVAIADSEIEISAVRAAGPGGQNVNKVASAIHLRFDLHSASLPQAVRQRLLDSGDSRITSEGVIVIKAQRYRTQEKNREDALVRLAELIRKATAVQKRRKPTKPTKASIRRRMDSKSKHGERKKLRRKVDPD